MFFLAFQVLPGGQFDPHATSRPPPARLLLTLRRPPTGLATMERRASGKLGRHGRQPRRPTASAGSRWRITTAPASASGRGEQRRRRLHCAPPLVRCLAAPLAHPRSRRSSTAELGLAAAGAAPPYRSGLCPPRLPAAPPPPPAPSLLPPPPPRWAARPPRRPLAQRPSSSSSLRPSEMRPTKPGASRASDAGQPTPRALGSLASPR